MAVLTACGGAYADCSARYVASLSGAQEVPANASMARGCGTFLIDTDANTVTYYIAFTGLGAAETAAHIHGFAMPGAAAGVKVALPAGNPKVGVWAYPEADEAGILGGLTYVNIHSAAFPGGEIRGQILSHVAELNGLQEVPPNGSAGTGWGVFLIDPLANTLSYYIAFGGLGSAETAAHIHGLATHGVAAGVKVALPAGSPKVGTWTYAEADEKAIMDGLMYVNIHSMGLPGGEIRGQIVATVAPMDGTQEVPPNASPGAGCGFISLDRGANVLGYDVRFAGLTAAETAAHIHGFAARGAAAGVKLALALGSPKLGTWAYAAADEASILAGLTYINIHSAAFPGGEIRGQIEFPDLCQRYCPCDMNCDGLVNAGDIPGFVQALTDPAGYAAAYPTCDAVCAGDTNGDGVFNAGDIPGFVACLTGP